MKECCSNYCSATPDSRGNNHHKMCSFYKTEKFPYLFYFEDAIDAWMPAPNEVEMIISVAGLIENKITQIEFKRVELTDEEYDNLPED